jgi:hypothetical protein
VVHPQRCSADTVLAGTQENAVDAVESALSIGAAREHRCDHFYLKAHRAQYRDKLNIDIKQLQGEIEDKIAQLRENGDVLPLVIPSLTQ